MKKFIISIISASLLIQGICFAEQDEEKSSVRCGLYYDGNGMLVGARNIVSEPSPEETELLLELYRPETAVEAKLFKVADAIEPEASYEVGKKHDINIINTNDIHGYFVGSDETIGIDKVAALKNMTGNALLLDAGNAVQGVSYAAVTRGEDVIMTMNTAGYDGMALGNHEFDYGLEQLYINSSLASFPLMSANAVIPERTDGRGTNIYDNYIYEVNGKKVGVFGLTTTSTLVSPVTCAGVSFESEIETAKKQIEMLDNMGADVIIALAHMGVNESAKVTSYQLAEALAGSGLDLIIDGHSHSVINTVESGIPIIRSGSYSQYVGDIGIDVAEDGGVNVDAMLLSQAFFDNIQADERTSQFIKGTLEEQSGLLETVISHSDTTLWGGNINGIAEPRIHETNLGDYLCDCMIASARTLLGDEYADVPVVAVENGGGVRAVIKKGAVKWEDVINELPFSNFLKCKEINPKVLYDVLEHSVSSVKSQDVETGLISSEMRGFFLQVGGMSFEYDPNAPVGSRVSNVFIDGTNEALDRDDTQTKMILASNDFIITGGDGFDMLADIPMLIDGGGLCEMLTDALRAYSAEQPFEYPVTQGRIRFSGAYEPKDYTARIYVKDSAGALKKDTDVSCYVDGKQLTGATDGEGILNITVTDGPHTVSLDGIEEVYVNNYSGNGVIEIEGERTYPALTLKNR